MEGSFGNWKQDKISQASEGHTYNQKSQCHLHLYDLGTERGPWFLGPCLAPGGNSFIPWPKDSSLGSLSKHEQLLSHQGLHRIVLSTPPYPKDSARFHFLSGALLCGGGKKKTDKETRKARNHSPVGAVIFLVEI